MTFFRPRIIRPPVLFSNLGVISVSVYLLDATPEYISLTYNDGRNERISIDRYKLSLDLGRYIETEEKANKIIKERAAAELKRTNDPRFKVICEETGEAYLPSIKNTLVDNIHASLDKVIKDVKLVDDDLVLTFLDDYVMVIYDQESCCEQRYFTTDDNLDDYKDAVFLGIVIKKFELENVDETDDGGPVHEISFMEIKTSKGPISITTHNEHNGYYGGINIRVDIKPPVDVSTASLQ